MSSFVDVTRVVAPLADKVPKENDVVAGWVGFAVFMFLVIAVALLCWSFTRHMRTARVNFGVEDDSTAIPVAGTPEGDAALAAASGQRGELREAAASDVIVGGKHRGPSSSE